MDGEIPGGSEKPDAPLAIIEENILAASGGMSGIPDEFIGMELIILDIMSSESMWSGEKLQQVGSLQLLLPLLPPPSAVFAEEERLRCLPLPLSWRSSPLESLRVKEGTGGHRGFGIRRVSCNRVVCRYLFKGPLPLEEPRCHSTSTLCL